MAKKDIQIFIGFTRAVTFYNTIIVTILRAFNLMERNRTAGDFFFVFEV